MMDKRQVLITAVSTGNCPFQILHIDKVEWNCSKFNDCKECANKLIDEVIAESNTDKNLKG